MENPSPMVPALGAGVPNPKAQDALRYNTGKPQLSYLLSAPEAVKGLSEVFTFGATKYARDNWKRGFKTHELVDSALRHLTLYLNGEDLDLNPVTGAADKLHSGLPHIDHVLWNILVLAEQYRTFPEKRPSQIKLEETRCDS